MRIVTGLRDPSMTVWTAWDGEKLLGLSALSAEVGSADGEVKSMRTQPEHLGRGVGRALLRTIIDSARERGLSRLSLETATSESFTPAHRLNSDSERPT